MRVLGILDTETSSLDPKTGHLLEVAIVRYSVEHAAVIDSWSKLIRAPSNEAEDTNGIPVGLLEFGASIETVSYDLNARLLGCDAVLAHHASFDREWLDERFGNIPDKPIWICTQDDFEWTRGKPGQSLVQLAIAHGVPVVAAHRALTDCGLIAGILAKYPTELPKMLERAARPRVLLQSKHPFQQNEAAKLIGFRWEAETKRWLKRHAKEDVAALTAMATWPLVEVMK